MNVVFVFVNALQNINTQGTTYYTYFLFIILCSSLKKITNNKRNIRRHIFVVWKIFFIFLTSDDAYKIVPFIKYSSSPTATKMLINISWSLFFIFSGKISYDTEHISFGYYFIILYFEAAKCF